METKKLRIILKNTKPKRVEHTTINEVEFLDELGTFSKFRLFLDELPDERRTRLLKNYKQSIPKRFNWGNVSRYDVAIHVNSLLKDLGQSLI
jgi:hypothetical protein